MPARLRMLWFMSVMASPDEPTDCASCAMLPAISPEPAAASAAYLPISFVVAVCSSTADAMVIW